MKRIFVDQCGYLPKAVKRATVKCEERVAFKLLSSTGDCVFEGESEEPFLSEASGDMTAVIDFSAVETPGCYMLTAKGCGESDHFVIDEECYEDALRLSIDFFMLQRCGFELTEKVAGRFAHKACHLTEAVDPETGKKYEVKGGWHDAGDYGRYIVPAAMTVAQLLLAYEYAPQLLNNYFAPGTDRKTAAENNRADGCACPDSKGMPDFLKEIKYELDWMLKLQREDGALFHKVSCRSFCGFIPPENEKEELVLSPVSVTATADFAAACAMASGVYDAFDREFSLRLEAAARKAYSAQKAMNMPGGFKNPADIVTGEYCDAEDRDERYFAAAAMYKAFGGDEYRTDFEKLAGEQLYSGYGWENMGSYGNLAYITCNRKTDNLLKERIEKSIMEEADRYLSNISCDGYEVSLAKEEYIWGSNLSVANNGCLLMDAFRLTGEEKYKKAAEKQINYLLGRNPMGLCYLTGCGTTPVVNPHHRMSAFLGKPMPGMLSGGPCSWLADDVAKELLKDEKPAKCIADMTGSYSTNEVTIYWNSAFVMLLAQLIRGKN